MIAERLHPVCEGRGWGYIDRHGRQVVAPTFKAADPFRDGLGRVKGQKGFAFVDASGSIVIDGLVEAYSFAGGFAKARRGKKWGYLAKDGSFAIPPRFLQCESFCEGFASAQDFETKLWGVIDARGEWVLAPSELGGARFSDGLALRQATKDGLFGYVSSEGRFVIPPRFSSALPFSEGLAWVEEDGQPKFIDRHGESVIVGDYQDPGGPREETGFHEGRALVRVGESLGYLGQPEGALVIPPRFHWAAGFHEGRAMAGPDDGSVTTTRQGFIDREGRWVVRPVLYLACSYEGGLARVHADPKRETVFGYIDLEGRWVWQPERGFGADMQELRA